VNQYLLFLIVLAGVGLTGEAGVRLAENLGKTKPGKIKTIVFIIAMIVGWVVIIWASFNLIILVKGVT